MGLKINYLINNRLKISLNISQYFSFCKIYINATTCEQGNCQRLLKNEPK